MSDPIRFFVPGIPKPGGSKRAIWRQGMVHARIVDASNNKDWKAVVSLKASESFLGPPLEGPLSVSYVFIMPRPKSHYRTGKRSHELRDDAPIYHTSTPDLTKLVRCAEDACSGILWRDDKQCAIQPARKEYGTTTGCFISVERIEKPTLWHANLHNDLFPKTQNCLD